MLKLSYAESERKLIDLYIELCNETNGARVKELEGEIIHILSHSTYE